MNIKHFGFILLLLFNPITALHALENLTVESKKSSTSELTQTSAKKQSYDLPTAQIWLTPPKISYQNIDLHGENRKFTVQLTRDAQGLIEQIVILHSTGIKALDEKILGQLKSVRLNPTISPQKLTLPILMQLRFHEQQSGKIVLKDHLSAKDAAKIWRYFPQLSYNHADLDGKTRQINFILSFDASGHLVKSQISQSSGLTALDRKIDMQLQQTLLYSQHAPINLMIPLILTAKPNHKD